MKSYLLKLFAVGAIILVSIVTLRIVDPYPIEVIRLKGLDYYQRSQPKVTSENVVVIEIDEKSLEEKGQWPWPRTELAEGIKKAFEAEAALVVLPIIFAEKDRMGGDPEFIDILQKVPVITSQSASIKGKGVPVPRGLASVGGQSDGWLYDYPNAIGPVKEIGESSAGVGMLLTAPELDGVVRRLPLIIQVKKETYPTLPLEILRVFGGEPSYQAKINNAGIQAVRVKGTPPINTDANGRVWVNFKYKFESVSYTDADWSKASGKIVVMALTAEGLANTVATPVGISQGYEVSMQTLQMLVDGNRLERKAEFDLYELIVGATFGILLILAAAYLGYVYNGVLVTALLCVPTVVGFYVFNKHGYLLDYTWPTLALFLPWVGAIFMRFVMEYKLKMQIKKQFGTYLAPAMVEKLQKNPNLLQLGGESKELTILFSDIRGYTALSEHFGKDVQGLTSLINLYMDAMLPIVMKNEGTVGKLIGDAVMAWWSAPIHVEDQATLAIKTAREMNTALTQLNAELKAKGIPTLSIGIGINTGEVVVGNMGSKERFSYDILGDAVNLASRLEGQTKTYGVLIILGENTVEKYKKEQNGVKITNITELDWIAVKGKKEGVKIYTILENQGVPLQSAVFSVHSEFLNQYRMQNWDKAISTAEVLIKHNKELTEYYEMMIERIGELRKSNLPPDWDGVFRATSK